MSYNKTMFTFLINLWYFNNPVKFLRKNFDINKDEKPYQWLIQHNDLKKCFEIAENYNQQNYDFLIKKGFNNKEILWMNSLFFSFISEPSESEIRYALKKGYWYLFSLKKITQEYFLCAIDKEKHWKLEDPINLNIVDRTKDWSDYHISLLFKNTDFDELKKIIRSEPFLITKMNPVNLELALIATLEHPKIYKYITCVENKTISDTVENLRAKIEILEALK